METNLHRPLANTKVVPLGVVYVSPGDGFGGGFTPFGFDPGEAGATGAGAGAAGAGAAGAGVAGGATASYKNCLNDIIIFYYGFGFAGPR